MTPVINHSEARVLARAVHNGSLVTGAATNVGLVNLNRSVELMESFTMEPTLHGEAKPLEHEPPRILGDT